MSKLRPLIAIAVLAIGIMSCTSDASSDEPWLDLVGRWENALHPESVWEYTTDGRYSMHWSGELHETGDYEADRDFLTFHIDPPCGSTCDVRNEYRVIGDTLIITTGGLSHRFNRISDSR